MYMVGGRWGPFGRCFVLFKESLLRRRRKGIGREQEAFGAGFRTEPSGSAGDGESDSGSMEGIRDRAACGKDWRDWGVVPLAQCNRHPRRSGVFDRRRYLQFAVNGLLSKVSFRKECGKVPGTSCGEFRSAGPTRSLQITTRASSLFAVPCHR